MKKHFPLTALSTDNEPTFKGYLSSVLIPEEAIIEISIVR